MRVPLDWLAEYVDLPAGATGTDVAASLVKVGLEEEGLHSSGVSGPLVLGRVLERVPEEQKNGKTINWCHVDVGAANGTGEAQGIVCGAHNFDVGDLVPVILPGGSLPGPEGPFVISARKTYGHVSAGMICSARELGLGDEHDGIIVLTDYFADSPEVLAQLSPGDDLIPVLGLDRETIEVNVTPDRGYCFSIRGIAREYSHATGAALTDPVLALDAAAPAPNADGHPVQLRDESPIRGVLGCDRYLARVVRGIDVAAPTPDWMARRLTEAGMRPISLAVDVTNYVMLALGQPLHAFDLAALVGPIVVRRAAPDEKLTTLDGAVRALDPQDLLITDSDSLRPIAIAGVMGGLDTEVTGDTRDILIEAAHFDAVTVARSARRHKLPSEASRRFERGVDPALPPAAAQLAVDLLVRFGGGVADPGVTDVGRPADPAPISLSPGFAARIVGVDYPGELIADILTSIGSTVQPVGELLTVTPPTWRPDLRTAEDLVEEIARIHGYEEIPSIVPTPPGGGGLTHSQRVRRIVADVLAGSGLSEVWSAPFVGEDRFAALGLDVEATKASTVRLANPLSDEAPYLRTAVLETLVDALRRNVARGIKDVGLFEVGTVVALDGPQQQAPTQDVGVMPDKDTLQRIRDAVPPQPRHVAYALAGERDRAGWWGPGRAADAADAIDLARIVAEAVGLRVVVTAGAAMPWHPGRCATLALEDGTELGAAGELHPKVVAALGLPPRTVAGELDVDALARASEAATQGVALATYPLALSDVALIVDDAVPASAVEAALRSAAGPLLESVTLFDVYDGEQLEAGRKSLAYRLAFRSAERTLTTDEVSGLRDAAVAGAAAAVGAVQRV